MLYLAKQKARRFYCRRALIFYKYAVFNFYRAPPTRAPRNDGGDDGDV
jgi:hypothetical protein